MPNAQTPQTNPRPNVGKGFFKALFARQNQPTAVPAVPTPTATLPARHALQDRFDAALQDIDAALKTARVAAPSAAKALDDRQRVLAEQYRQALAARQKLASGEAEQTVTAVLQKLLVKVEALKVEAAQAASTSAPASLYVPVPRDEPLEVPVSASAKTPLQRVYVDEMATPAPLQPTVRGYIQVEAPPQSLGYAEEFAVHVPPQTPGYAEEIPVDWQASAVVVPVANTYYGSEDEGEEGDEPDPSLLRHYGSGQRASAPVVARVPAPKQVVEGPSQKALKEAYPCRLDGDLGAYQKGDSALGSGYFGETYACTDAQGRKLVLKTPIGEPGNKALLKEAKAYKAVGDHPNIAKCHGVGNVGGEDGLILEHIEGKTATAAMSELRLRYEKGEITPEEYWAVVRYTLKQMVAAQQHMAKAGITHNDIRLDNVMIESATGRVLVIDLGLGTPGGEKIGTAFPYTSVAPEVLTSQPPVPQSDTYMIGNTAHVLGEQHEHTYGLSADTSQPQGDLKEAAKVYQSTNGVPIKPPGIEQQKARQAPALAHAIAPQDGPADAPNAVPVGPRAAVGHGTPAQRCAARLDEVEKRMAKAANGEGVQNDTFGAIKKGQTLAASLEALLAKARSCAATARYDEALGILAEIEARLQDGARKPDEHQLDTLYTDFINRMMSGDPAQRLSPEEALNHPFFTASTPQMIDASATPEHDGRAVADAEDELARRLLQQQLQPKGAAPALQADASPADRRRWLAEREREIGELEAWLPNLAPERRQLLDAVRAQVETDPKFQGDTQQAKSLIRMLNDARADRQSRKLLDERLVAQADKARQRWAASPTALAAFEKRVKAAATLLKPGGSLEEARALLDEFDQALQG